MQHASIEVHKRGRITTALLASCVLTGVLAGAAGCAKARAETVPDGPPLATPAPPPREFAPIEELAAVPIESPTSNAPAAITTKPSAEPARGAATPRRDPEPKADAAAAQPAAAPPPAAEPPRELRSSTSPNAAAEAQKVRDVLNAAETALKAAEGRKLSPERKLQFEQSRRFVQQAEDALKDRNYPYAMTLADKAKQLADELLR
jgi:hypothetical protein